MRPFPPADMIADFQPRFEPAPELEQWVREQFINELSELNNPDHEHLQQADIAFLWTNVPNQKRQRTILGQCQMVTESGDKWSQGRALLQLRQWFDQVPEFLITIDANAAIQMDDASFMALVEHELYHIAHQLDEFGSPKFTKDGAPVFCIRGHDIEEFVGVVERYGAAATGMEEAVRAANKGPTVALAQISRACGTCLRLVKG